MTTRFVTGRTAPWIAAAVALLLSLLFGLVSDRSWVSMTLEAALLAVVIFFVVRSSR